MGTTMLRSILVVGAIYADIDAECPACLLTELALEQEFGAAKLSVGGTGANIARALSRVHDDVTLLTITGNDYLGGFVCDAFASECPTVKLWRLNNDAVETGIVLLVHFEHEGRSRRKVLGPARALIDMIDGQAIVSVIP